MDICIICPEIGKAGTKAFIGGHVNNVVRLSRYLAEAGHNLTIVTTPHRHSTGQDSIEYAEVHTLPIYDPYLSLRYSLKFITMAVLKVRKLSKDKNFDVIHGHSGYLSPVLITALSSKASGIPSVHSVYCPVEKSKIRNIAVLMSGRFPRKLYLSQVDKIIAVTENIANSLKNIGVQNGKLEVVPLVVDTSVFNPTIRGEDIRRRFGISDEPTLVYVGNLSRVKGIHVLLDALKIVKEQYSDVKLLMVLNLPIEKFENPERFEVDMELIIDVKRKIKDYNLEDNVIPIGLTEEMAKIMAAGDIFVMPFLEITGVADYPLSLLEAMAIGLPAVATKVGGVPEIIRNGENGILINPGNPFELAKAILYMLENRRKAERMGYKAAMFISEKFRPEVVIKTLEKIYKSVGGVKYNNSN